MDKIFLIAAVLFIGNLGVVLGQAGSEPKDATDIKTVLNSTAEGWNANDLSKYLAAYVPEAEEMTANGPKGGVGHIEQTMKSGFWKGGTPEQKLRFESVKVTLLGKKNALVTGRYVLTGGGKPDTTGWFTTVWVKAKQGWRMMHDHSS